MANMKQLHEGVKILMEYEPEAYSLVAEHDQFWCGNTPPYRMTETERGNMEKFGWIWDEDIGGWYIFP